MPAVKVKSKKILVAVPKPNHSKTLKLHRRMKVPQQAPQAQAV